MIQRGDGGTSFVEICHFEHQVVEMSCPLVITAECTYCSQSIRKGSLIDIYKPLLVIFVNGQTIVLSRYWRPSCKLFWNSQMFFCIYSSLYNPNTMIIKWRPHYYLPKLPRIESLTNDAATTRQNLTAIPSIPGRRPWNLALELAHPIGQWGYIFIFILSESSMFSHAVGARETVQESRGTPGSSYTNKNAFWRYCVFTRDVKYLR